MGTSADDIDKYAKLIALLQEGILELGKFIQNKQEQGGKTTEEIFDHATKSNAEAKALIDSL